MKAVIRARGTLTHWQEWNARSASAIPGRGNHQRLDAGLSPGIATIETRPDLQDAPPALTCSPWVSWP